MLLPETINELQYDIECTQHTSLKFLKLLVMKNIYANEQDDTIDIFQNGILSNRFDTQCFQVNYTMKVDELLIITFLCYIF